MEDRDRFIAIPIALELQTVLVEPSAAVAVTQVVRIEMNAFLVTLIPLPQGGLVPSNDSIESV